MSQSRTRLTGGTGTPNWNDAERIISQQQHASVPIEVHIPKSMMLLPHGGYPLFPAALSAMAWIASLSQDGCDYARISGPEVTTLTNSDEYPFAEVGFDSYRVPTYYPEHGVWRVLYTAGCLPYDYGDEGTTEGSANTGDWSYDIYWKVGRTTHLIASIFGGAGCLFLWFAAMCMVFTKRTWHLGGAELMVAAFFQCMSFFWFANEICSSEETKCHLFFGSKMDIASACLYIVAAASIFLKYPEPKVVKYLKKSIEADYLNLTGPKTAPASDSSSLHLGLEEENLGRRDDYY